MKMEIQVSKVGHEYWEILQVRRRRTEDDTPIVETEVLSRVWLNKVLDRYVLEVATYDGKVGSKPVWLRVGPSFLTAQIAFRYATERGRVKA